MDGIPESETSDQLAANLRSIAPPLVIDARRNRGSLAATQMLEGAIRRDPESVAAWVTQLPQSARVVDYCARGGEVSQRGAAALKLFELVVHRDTELSKRRCVVARFAGFDDLYDAVPGLGAVWIERFGGSGPANGLRILGPPKN